VKLGQRAKAELLSAVPLFSHCSKRELATLAKLGNQVDLPAGHTLIRADARVAYSFFVIVEGAAEGHRDDRLVATLGPGDFFGELALILRRPRTATVTLTAPSRLLAISAHNFQPLLLRSPEIQSKLLESLADRVAALTASG
jgi:CRP-like cAMP-binding protein